MKNYFDKRRVVVNLQKAFKEFLSKAPRGILKKTGSSIYCIDMADTKYKIYKPHKNSEKNILMIFGNLEDLGHSAIVGLVAHLFALIDINYHKNFVPTGQEWLSTDLYSDDVAKDWGFKKEVEELRKIRPQKIPEEVIYPNIVINHSAPSKKFNTDIRSILSERNMPAQMDKRVWYVDRFSMICDIQNLRKLGINHLHVLTDKYTYGELRKIVNK